MDQIWVMGSPILKAKAFHEKTIGNQSELSANQFVTLQLIKLICQEHLSPSILRVFGREFSIDSCVHGVVLALISDVSCVMLDHLWPLPVNEEEINCALEESNLKEHSEDFGAKHKAK